MTEDLTARLIALRDHLKALKRYEMHGCHGGNVEAVTEDQTPIDGEVPEFWIRASEIDGLITALRQDPRSEKEKDDQARVDVPSLVGGSDLPQPPPELASTPVENDLSRVTRFEVINETGRVYGHRPCTVQLSFQDAGRTLKVFVNWPRVNQSHTAASPEEALKLTRTVDAVDRESEASTGRPRAPDLLADPTRAAAPAPQDPPGKACVDCGAALNAGEAKIFTVCDACWDKVYATSRDVGAYLRAGASGIPPTPTRF